MRLDVVKDTTFDIFWKSMFVLHRAISQRPAKAFPDFSGDYRFSFTSHYDSMLRPIGFTGN
jgi:hypothetical protein